MNLRCALQTATAFRKHVGGNEGRRRRRRRRKKEKHRSKNLPAVSS
jgi:hypothetical protein